MINIQKISHCEIIEISERIFSASNYLDRRKSRNRIDLFAENCSVILSEHLNDEDCSWNWYLYHLTIQYISEREETSSMHFWFQILLILLISFRKNCCSSAHESCLHAWWKTHCAILIIFIHQEVRWSCTFWMNE